MSELNFSSEFTEPWPDILEALGVEFCPAEIAKKKKLELYGVLKKRVSALSLSRKINSLSPLKFFLQLESLLVQEAPISDLSPLSNLSKLKELNLMCCKSIQDLKPLSGLSRLTELYLQCTAVSDITPLSSLSSLKILSLEYTKVVSLTPLAHLKLKELIITGTGVVDLSPLREMPLEKLSVYKSKVSKAELTAFKEDHPQCVVEAGNDYTAYESRCSCGVIASPKVSSSKEFMSLAEIYRSKMKTQNALTQVPWLS
jgi:Leucine-rich repeat (LRR) protein